MKRLIALISILMLCAIHSAVAQNFEDAFNAFVQQNEQSFNRFADSINKAFAEAMEANIRTFTGEQPKVRDPKPKPVKLPEAEKKDVPKELPSLPKPAPAENKEPIKEPAKPTPSPAESPVESVTPPSELLNWTEFDLFGDNIRYVKKTFPERMKGISPKDVSAFWIRLSECDYEPMLQQCLDAQKSRGFNDWAVYQLVLELANQTYPRLYNEQAVMAVFLLNQLGLEAKVGFGNSHLFCLLAVDQQLYGLSFADIAKSRYYLLEVDPNYINREGTFAFRTYDTPFPEPTKGLDMNISKPLKSSEFPDLVDSAINISTSMIELFSTYPQVDIAVYANAQPSIVFCQSLEQVFQPYLRTQTTVEAVDFLLAYVQYGFDYATDDEQFGYEKPFFCEENFYYPQNDCEDRSVLFSFLVRHLMHLDVVLVDYPGHVATAVHFNENVPGTAIMHQGKRYVICDPTYIGASIGTEMPGFAPEDRMVIPIKEL